MLKRQGIWLLLLALMITAISTWLNTTWTNHQQFTENYNKEKISYYFTRFSLLTTNDAGISDYKLTGKHFSHWKEKQQSEISTPQITTLMENGSTHSHSSAKTALIHHTDKRFELIDQVVLREFDDQQKLASTLTTEKLQYFVDSREITTDLPFQLKTIDSKVTGTGLHGDMETKQVQVLSNAKTIYEPKQ
jgi:lipopolysaccharide export system protein LptC